MSAEPAAPSLEAPGASAYHRYHIAIEAAPDRSSMPSRFRVHVRRHRLAWLLLREMFHYRLNLKVVFSRPCVYGVFSGPIGGFAPRPKLCVGCLRCTTEFPDVVQITRNPERKALGDSYFTPSMVDAVTYEAESGRVPVKGAGYRGRFGGDGWDAMWTDMSEIVRPTRDGIHGREFISTAVDIGTKPSYLRFDASGRPEDVHGRTFPLPLPILFDAPPLGADTPELQAAILQAARRAQTLAVVPAAKVKTLDAHTVPLVRSGDQAPLQGASGTPRMLELAAWDLDLFRWLHDRYPQSLIALRVSLGQTQAQGLLEGYEAGVRVFHLEADFHGRGEDGRFALELIREAHAWFVARGVRDEVTLIGSGGMVAAEHVPKAIIAGLDAVALDTTTAIALQARIVGETKDRARSRLDVPPAPEAWVVQRLLNLLGSWRDQLLEILGAMGLREVRRLRGEIGRSMFQPDLEREAFGDIEGYAELA